MTRLAIVLLIACGHREPATRPPVANTTPPAPIDAPDEITRSDACTSWFTTFDRAKACDRLDAKTILRFEAVQQEINHSGDSINAGGDFAVRALRYCADETAKLTAIASGPCGW